MSERLTSMEIEDVLSSIRRLVSEDMRPLLRSAMAETAQANQKSALILTPALRVVPASEPVVVPEPALPIEKVVAAVGAAVDVRTEEWESETGDSTIVSGSAWTEVNWNTPSESAEAVVEADIDPGEEHLPVDQFGSEDVMGSVEFEAARAEPSTWTQGGIGEQFVFRSHLVPPTAPVSTDGNWADAAEAEVIASLEQSEPDEPEIDRRDDSPEMTFDEEVLRDLVRDLIREELQGHLGERITRNIRKLVRAEIARSLAVAEFE